MSCQHLENYIERGISKTSREFDLHSKLTVLTVPHHLNYGLNELFTKKKEEKILQLINYCVQ
jgi:hypothetical protein